MSCEHPDDYRGYALVIAADGAKHVKEACFSCWRPVNAAFSLSAQEVARRGIRRSTLEVIDDRRGNNPPCEVCGDPATQLHHWAPTHLFGSEAGDWPTGYLCQLHHRRWHDVVTPDMHRVRTPDLPPYFDEDEVVL